MNQSDQKQSTFSKEELIRCAQGELFGSGNAQLLSLTC